MMHLIVDGVRGNLRAGRWGKRVEAEREGGKRMGEGRKYRKRMCGGKVCVKVGGRRHWVGGGRVERQSDEVKRGMGEP